MDKRILDFLQATALEALRVNSSLENWAASIGETLYSNQVEIINTMCDPHKRNITILASRSAGKTYGVALGAIKLCLDNPGYEVLFFGPRSGQAERILGVIQKIAKKAGNKHLFKEIDWYRTNVSRVAFKNGSTMEALSGDEGAQVEGWHADMVVLDEAHQISNNVFNRRIVPMIKSAKDPKVVKIGISMFKGHFYESCHDPQWTNLVYPWNVCENLFNAGVTTIDGVDYPNSILEDMPLTYKMQRFPNYPAVHFKSKVNMSEEDFDVQYDMKWTDSLSKYLTDRDVDMLVGGHNILQEGDPAEEYYFGIDFAGGALIEQGSTADSTQLTVLRKFPDGKKEVVYVHEWQGDTVDQIEEIASIVNPLTGVFKCKFGTADYSTMGIGMVDRMIKVHKLPLAGIKPKGNEPVTGRPYKIAMFDNWLMELRQGYFKYPSLQVIGSNNLLKLHIEQWEALERTISESRNIRIAAPLNSNIHDDCPNSTVLACWAADKMQDELRKIQRSKTSPKIQKPIFMAGTTTSRRMGTVSRQSVIDRHMK